MLRAQQLPLLAVFAHVCRQRSLTKAASVLGISKSVVSANIRALEQVLGARLLERTTRRVAPTQTGEAVLAAAERLLAAADEVGAIAESEHNVPTGTLRVAAPVDLGALLVAPAVARLCAKYSGLRAELVLSDSRIDPIAHQFDAMLLVNVPKDSSLVTTQLASDTEIIVASPELAKEWQTAKQPRDLTGAPWISHTSIPINTRARFRNRRGTLQQIVPREARIVTNTADSIRSLVVASAGFAVVPSQVVLDDMRAGRVVRVLSDWSGRTVRVHLCLPSGRHSPRRVVAFVEELRAVFGLSGLKAQYTGAAPRHELRYPPR
jgi:DNA-binding transcriptional LysR family regulator